MLRGPRQQRGLQAVLEPGEGRRAGGRGGSEVCEGGRRRREEDGLACSVLQGIGNIRPVTAVRATMPVIPFCHPFSLD